MELQLTDAEAEKLLNMLKIIIENHKNTIKENENTQGDILISSSSKEKFILSYKYSLRSKVFNLRETNLNSNFHKNADGSKVYGNRINIFSEQEFYDKNDGQTHCKTYPLPFKNIENTDDFLRTLDNLLIFSNIDKNNNLSIHIQGNLI